MDGRDAAAVPRQRLQAMAGMVPDADEAVHAPGDDAGVVEAQAQHGTSMATQNVQAAARYHVPYAQRCIVGA